jgi:hypothetical protein
MTHSALSIDSRNSKAECEDCVLETRQGNSILNVSRCGQQPPGTIIWLFVMCIIIQTGIQPALYE